MRKGIWLAAGVVFFAVPYASWAQQQAAQTSPSQSAAQTKSEKSGTQATAKSDPLVQAARQAREARKETPTHSVVFTNDNMPTSATAISIVGNASASAESSASVRAVKHRMRKATRSFGAKNSQMHVRHFAKTKTSLGY